MKYHADIKYIVSMSEETANNLTVIIFPYSGGKKNLNTF